MGTSNPGRMDEREMARSATTAAVEAKDAADAAEILAQTAMSTADGKGTRYDIAAGDPRPDGQEYDTLFEWDPDIRNGVVSFVGSWDPITEDWVAQEAGHQTIASLDLGKATVGTLNVNNSVNIEATTTGGGHVRLNGNGLEGLDSSDNRKTFIGSDGTLEAEDATITGVFRTGGSDSNGVVIRPFPASGTPQGGIIEFQGTPNVGANIALRNSIINLSGAGLSGAYGEVMLTGSQMGDGVAYVVGSSATSSGYSGIVDIRGKSASASGDGDVRITGAVDFTNAATKQSARNSLGLGNTTGPVPVANGGTGVTTAAAERNRLGLGNTTGALPIANGGTGATTAAAAKQNLDIAHAQAAGSGVSYAAPAANGGSTAVTIIFPSGRFTAAPIVNASSNNGRHILAVASVSTTSATINVFNWTTVASAAVLQWHAVQMTPTSGAG